MLRHLWRDQRVSQRLSQRLLIPRTFIERGRHVRNQINQNQDFYHLLKSRRFCGGLTGGIRERVIFGGGAAIIFLTHFLWFVCEPIWRERRVFAKALVSLRVPLDVVAKTRAYHSCAKSLQLRRLAFAFIQFYLYFPVFCQSRPYACLLSSVPSASRKLKK